MRLFQKFFFIHGVRPCRQSQTDSCGQNQIAAIVATSACLSMALFMAFPLVAQSCPGQRLTQAYKLEREGKAASAITELESLLDSKSLDAAGTGKAWNVLGLAYEDRGDFSTSRRAFEHSIQAYEAVPNDRADYAMALDDFGELYVTTGELDLAVTMMERALNLYEAAQDHAGVVRASSDLAGALFSQKKIRQGRQNLDRALKQSRLTEDLGEDDLANLASLQGWLAQCEGDLPTSISKYQQSLDILEMYHGEEYASTGWGYVLLGQVRAQTGDLSRSLTEMAKGLGILGRTLNSLDPRFLTAEIAYSHVLDMAGQRSEAQSIRSTAEEKLRTFRDSQCLDCTVSAKAFR